MAITNKVYLSPGTFSSSKYVTINDNIFCRDYSVLVPLNEIALNTLQRKLIGETEGAFVNVVSVSAPTFLTGVTLEISSDQYKNGLDCERFEQYIRDRFVDIPMVQSQQLALNYQDVRFFMTVLITTTQNNIMNLGENFVSKENSLHSNVSTYGCITDSTNICFTLSRNAKFTLKNNRNISGRSSLLFKGDFDFSQLGIGGLDREFSTIFRRAFASRMYPSSFISDMGLTHCRGILLYGPPGTGKTLIARQIGKVLNCKEIKIVNGPELFNKYVGETENAIRNLFKDAEADQTENGDNSGLHLIVFDEIDAMCKSRGSGRDGTGVGDSAVNQLLTKIDGVDTLNNVLIIGMTNRKDLIDEALLRPGRLELQIEISLPDEAGREDIFKIHVSSLDKNGKLYPDVCFAELAKVTKNYTGAEIAGVVRAATSYALDRQIDHQNIKESKIDIDQIKISRADFIKGISEIKAAYGSVDISCPLIIHYGPSWQKVCDKISSIAKQLARTSNGRKVTVLLKGSKGSGKTSVAKHIATTINFPFMKMVSSDMLIGLSDINKITVLREVFDNARRSVESVLILDDIESLVEFNALGTRYSNTMFQAIHSLINRSASTNHNLLIIGTCQNSDFLEDVGLRDSFNIIIDLPKLITEDELYAVIKGLSYTTTADLKLPFPVSINKLLSILDMAAGLKDIHMLSTNGLSSIIIDSNMFNIAWDNHM